MISSLSAAVQAIYRRIFAGPSLRGTSAHRGFAVSHLTIARRRAVLPALLLAALASTLVAQTPDTESGNQKPENGFHTTKDRLNAMHSAVLFVPGKVGEVDIAAGPPQQKNLFQIHDGDKLICDFKTPGNKMGGKTPKFGCQITSVESANGKTQTLTSDIQENDPIKVKFGATDNEVFAEIVSTRLMWAIGYYADAWYPFQVECHGCPEDPISGSGATATRTHAVAKIVHQLTGQNMTEIGKDEQGWSWTELDTANGRPVYERDGLKLVAAFIQHSDNKPPQQRLTCHIVTVDGKTQPPTTTCDQSIMLVQDIGATFGGGGLFTSNDSAKMNIEQWSGKKLWKNAGTVSAPHACQANLRKSLAAKNGLSDPAISEDGRRFDAGLMCQLSDQQIEALFRAARVAAMPKYHNQDGSFKSGVDEASVVHQWVEAFKQKREDLASARCEWKDKPADLAVIDNPMGLAEVPNFCSSKPF